MGFRKPEARRSLHGLADSSKAVSSSRRLLLVPLLISLFIQLPTPRHFVAWLDAKVTDLYFVLLPSGEVRHPSLVVAKDQLALDSLGHEPGRPELAKSLDLLRKAGARVAALDFIYDAPLEPVADARLARALERFPAAILATRFHRRTALVGGRTVMLGLSSGPPPPPLPLYEPLASVAAGRGFVNLFLDYDGVVRALPLAFRTSGSAELQLTLGFAAFLERVAARSGFSPGAGVSLPRPGAAEFSGSAGRWLHTALEAAPRRFRSTGHPGLDLAVRRRELLWLARLAAAEIRGPGAPDRGGVPKRDARLAWRTVAEELDLTTLPDRSWLDLPKDGLPLFGPDYAPSLRVRFRREAWPQKGDGIPTVSMGMVLGRGTRASETVRIAAAGKEGKTVYLGFDWSEPGEGILEGRVIDFGGRPLAGVQVLCRQAAGGYWTRAVSGVRGGYRCQGLPSGRYQVSLWKRMGDAVQRLDLEVPVQLPGVGHGLGDPPKSREAKKMWAGNRSPFIATGPARSLAKSGSSAPGGGPERSGDRGIHARRDIPGTVESQASGDCSVRSSRPACIGSGYPEDHDRKVITGAPGGGPAAEPPGASRAGNPGTLPGIHGAVGAERQRDPPERPPMTESRLSKGSLRLADARFLPGEGLLTGTLLPWNQEQRVTLFADGVWVAVSGAAGEMPFRQPPPGLELVPLAGDEGLDWSADGLLRGPDGEVLPGRRVALLEPAPQWKSSVTATVSVPASATEFEIRGIPPALGARVALLRDEPGAPHGRPAEVDILDGRPARIAGLDRLGSFSLVPIPVSLEFSPDAPPDLRIWFLDGEAGWRPAELQSSTIGLPSGKYSVFAASGTRRGTFNRLAGLVSGRTLFFGTTLPEDLDFRMTPINFLDRDFHQLPGVNLHANLLSALVRRDFLWPTILHPDASPIFWPLWDLLALLPILVLLDEIFRRWGGLAGGLASLGAVGLWIATSALLFLNQWLLPSALPALALGSFGVARGVGAYLAARGRERMARETFGRFVSPVMVEQILRHPERLRPGGEKRVLTVMFTDLAGFTSISEKLEPEALTALMNEYLGEMTQILFEHGGTLDKYIGDAIMGFWNHPSPQPDHAALAARCVLAMDARLAELRDRWLEQGLPRVSMRVGLNSAPCVVGFVGSAIQMNFTCLGDGVNLAARLEGANKVYGTSMMISEFTKAELDGAGIPTRYLDLLVVKGKRRPIRVFELMEEGHPVAGEVLALYHKGVEQYRARNWREAEATFLELLEQVPGDGPSEVYLGRCRLYAAKPPPADWDGCFVMTGK